MGSCGFSRFIPTNELSREDIAELCSANSN